MIVVFTMAAAIWGIGWAMKTPHQARWIMIGLLFVGVLFIHVILPDGHPLREGTGGDARLWLLIGGFAAIAALYRKGLMWLRARTNPVSADPPEPQGPNTVELERNARHIVLREIGGPGQTRLKNARVLVVGAGGLGAPVLQYLAAAGVGTLGVIDDDAVENSNLARQVIHRDADIGTPKVFSAERAMRAQNPFVKVKPYHRRLDAAIADELLADYDLVVDGTDNFDTRYLLNRAATARGIPLVFGALTQWEGQISVFDPARGSPCYACVFPQRPDPSLAPSCAEAGVLGPLPGVLGSMMAVEVIKVLTDAGAPLRGAMLLYDAQDAAVRKIRISARPDCPVCGANP